MHVLANILNYTPSVYKIELFLIYLDVQQVLKNTLNKSGNKFKFEKVGYGDYLANPATKQKNELANLNLAILIGPDSSKREKILNSIEKSMNEQTTYFLSK